MKNPLKPLAALLPALLTVSPAGAQQHAAAGPETVSTIADVTVYASRFEEQLTDALPQTSIVTAAEIQKSGASNISEVLARVVGLPVRSNLDGSTNAVVDMRGYGDTAPNNVVILLDGVRLSESEQTAARTSMIPLEAIDHIEITRTGNSVLYGDGANGGTINIVTRKKMGNLTVVSGGLASYSGYQSGLYHSQALENGEWSLFARQYASDNYRSNARGAELSAGASWIRRLDAQTSLGARFFSSQERNKLPGALPSVYLETSPRSTQVPGYNWDANVDSRSLTLFAKKSIDHVDLAIDLNERTRTNSDAYSYDARDVYAGYNYASNWTRSYGDSSSQSRSQSLNPRLKINHFLIANNVLQVGYDWLKTTKDGQAFLTFGCTAGVCSIENNAGSNTYQMLHRTRGWYVRDVLDLSDVAKITLGYRRENFSQTWQADYGAAGGATYSAEGNTSAGEIQYSRKFKDHFQGYVRLSRNFRIANADDNALSAAGDYAYPNWYPKPLQVQVSRDADIGLSHRSDWMISEVSYFQSDLRNEIGYDPALSGNVNYDPTRREGFHLRHKLALSKLLALRANLQHVQARFVDGPYAGKDVPGVSEWSGNVSLDYQLSPSQQIALTSRFAQSRHMSGDFSNSQSKVPGYAVEDLVYFWKEKNWSVVAMIVNITNKKYADTGIFKPINTPPYNLTLYPNPGRSFSVTGRYAF